MFSEFSELQSEINDTWSKYLSSILYDNEKGLDKLENSTLDAISKLIKEFGYFELFGDDESEGLDSFTTLCGLSIENGKKLCPIHLAEASFFGSFLIKKLGEDYSRNISCGPLEVSGGVIVDNKSLIVVPGTSALKALVFLDRTNNKILIVNNNNVKLSSFDAVDITQRFIKAEELKAFEIRGDLGEIIQLYNLTKISELYGCLFESLNMAIDHVKTRKQFNVPIGGFQAIQHKLSDVYLKLESLRSLLMFSIWASQNSKDQFNISSNSLVIFCRDVCNSFETLIQVHGGIGFTWEYKLHRHLRRAFAILQLIKASENFDTEFLKEASSS